MRKKDLERKIEDLELEMKRLVTKEDALYTERTIDCYIDNMRIREWLIKTKFIGNLKDKGLIELLKTYPLASERDFKEGYHSPAFDVNYEKTLAEKIGQAAISCQKIANVISGGDYATYNNICEEIRCQKFTNIQRLYDRIVELEKLEMFLDKYRPLQKKSKAKPATKKTAVVLDKKTKKGEVKNEK